MNSPVFSSEACAIERIGHVQKKICMLWGSPELDAYINKLLMDSRDGQRQGFPVQVTQELLYLAEFNKFIQAIDLARKLKVSLRDALQKIDQVDIDPENPLAGGGGRTDRGSAQVTRPASVARAKKESGNAASSFGQMIFTLLTSKAVIFLIFLAITYKLLSPYLFKTPV
jgi:hypothetical protein